MTQYVTLERPQETNINDFMACISRRRKIIFLFAFLFLIGGLICGLLAPVFYESHAQIMLTREPHNTLPNETFLLNTVEILKTRDVAAHTVAALQLNPQDKAIRHIQRHLTVKPVGRSMLIDITYRDKQANRSAEVVAQIIRSYQEHASLSATNERPVEKQHPIHIHNALSQQINSLTVQLAHAQAEKAVAEAELTQENAVSTPLVDTLAHDEARLRTQLAPLQSKYGNNHPRLKAAMAKLTALQNKIAHEVQNNTKTAEKNALMAQVKVASLQQSLDQLQAPQKAAYSAEENAATNKKSTVQVVSKPYVPTQPENTPIIIIAMLSIVIGLMVGLMAALLLDQMEMPSRTQKHTQ